ncbi:MAG: acetate kinase [Coriobacteriales bacterium]|jgi:acetate kinase|nr:acetate kinase [Coriobacteriales bacterium]
MKVLVMNAGSSSLKYQLIDMQSHAVIAKGLCEKVGFDGSFHSYELGKDEALATIPLADHHVAVKEVLSVLLNPNDGVIASLDEIAAIGHRVVHGGEFFTESVVISDAVIEKIVACTPLAPLHNPGALMGIEACKELMPNALQVAVFDTAFHQSMPAKAYRYPLPDALYEEHRIRKYGFHGTSHRYVSQRAAVLLERPLEELKLITCHLGNGCSLTAIEGGRSVDTTMGFTPLDGVMMGTRCGAIDPAIVTYLISELGMTVERVNEVMNRESGLLGISGLTNDLRDVRAAAEAGDPRAILAYEMYSNSVKKHIGQQVFTLAGVDAIVLTAGVGENCDRMRRMIFEGLEPLGITLDLEKNKGRGGERLISTEDSPVKVFVIPTNEELMIALDVDRLYQQQ